MERKLLLNKDLYTEIHKCIRCGQCTYGKEEAAFVTLCPMYKKGSFFSYSAGGIMQIARMLFEGKAEYSSILQDIVNHCTTCSLCEDNCGVITDHLKIIALIKDELRKRGHTDSVLETVLNNILTMNNPYGYEHEKRNTGVQSNDTAVSASASLLYFVGCVSAYDQKEVPQTFSTILRKSNCTYTLLSDEVCCGSPLFFSGMLDRAREYMQRNVEMIVKTGITDVVASCPTCVLMFTRYYPELLGSPLPFTMYHTTQYIQKLFAEKKITLHAVEGIHNVIYHDSCHLGRGLGIFDEPRELIQMIPGVKLHEFEFNRENNQCCGGGGMIPVVDQEFSQQVGIERINAITQPVDALVTACPNCKKTLRLVARRQKKPFKVYDLFELIDHAMQ